MKLDAMSDRPLEHGRRKTHREVIALGIATIVLCFDCVTIMILRSSSVIYFGIPSRTSLRGHCSNQGRAPYSFTKPISENNFCAGVHYSIFLQLPNSHSRN